MYLDISLDQLAFLRPTRRLSDHTVPGVAKCAVMGGRRGRGPSPSFGLTNLLDAESTILPPGIEASNRTIDTPGGGRRRRHSSPRRSPAASATGSYISGASLTVAGGVGHSW
jgi:hypothetical protein